MSSRSCLITQPHLPDFLTSLPCWFSPRSMEDGEDEEIVHMGNAIMSFYSALIDLLGRCAPEMHVSSQRATLRGLSEEHWRFPECNFFFSLWHLLMRLSLSSFQLTSKVVSVSCS